MNPRKVLIVEDEVLIARDLREIVQRLHYEVVGSVRRAADALALLEQHPPDVVLIDIMLRGELDGIDLASRLRAEYAIPFIFITSLSDAATVSRATRTRPYGYLVKPFHEQDVFVALEVAFATYAAERAAPAVTTASVSPDSIFVRHHKQLLKISFEDLLWLQADDTYTHLYTRGAKHTVSHTLKYLEEHLPAADFVRVHKSFMVALRRIITVDAQSLTLQDGKIIPVGRAYHAQLLSRLNLLEPG